MSRSGSSMLRWWRLLVAAAVLAVAAPAPAPVQRDASAWVLAQRALSSPRPPGAERLTRESPARGADARDRPLALPRLSPETARVDLETRRLYLKLLRILR
ncbi:MAG: hypothetical protein IPG04_16055 [Polyangiaceae bacterium]|nr:hypothetical protein [Polyangiaceae bacterium]